MSTAVLDGAGLSRPCRRALPRPTLKLDIDALQMNAVDWQEGEPS
jgi:hypothetical protein